MAYNFKMAGHTMKRTEIWDSGIYEYFRFRTNVQTWKVKIEI